MSWEYVRLLLATLRKSLAFCFLIFCLKLREWMCYQFHSKAPAGWVPAGILLVPIPPQALLLCFWSLLSSYLQDRTVSSVVRAPGVVGG